MNELISGQIGPEQNVHAQVSGEKISCCSRYRVCSDAKKCVCTNLEIAFACAYRDNLTAGQIFYGKNANGFSSELYEKIQKEIAALPDRDRFAVYSLIFYLRGSNRGAEQRVVRKETAEILEKTGLFALREFSSSLPFTCSLKVLRKRINNSEFYDSFRLSEAQYKREKASNKAEGTETKFTVPFVSYWLMNEGKTFRDHMASSYRIAFVRPETLRYIEELYCDQILSGKVPFGYPISPLVEDGLLIPSDAAAEIENAERWNHA